jgi:hypothetical protein
MRAEAASVEAAAAAAADDEDEAPPLPRRGPPAAPAAAAATTRTARRRFERWRRLSIGQDAAVGKSRVAVGADEKEDGIRFDDDDRRATGAPAAAGACAMQATADMGGRCGLVGAVIGVCVCAPRGETKQTKKEGKEGKERHTGEEREGVRACM